MGENDVTNVKGKTISLYENSNFANFPIPFSEDY